jgi:indole-3-glycerol phosphate synthase
MNILGEIIAAKRKEIEKGKAFRSIQSFENDGLFNVKARSLVQSLDNENSTGIIAEFKRKSPSKGWFKQKELKVETVVKAYDNFGATGISILTDEDYFGGSINDLVLASEAVSIPVLRKDFIIDQWQVAESRASGADVILLIAACLTREQVKYLAAYAKKTVLEVLLEIHNEKELDHICDEVDMVGVNNRDLETFEVNTESGITNAEVIKELRQAGFKGFLIGERFMKENDPGKAFGEFVSGLKPFNE